LLKAKYCQQAMPVQHFVNLDSHSIMHTKNTQKTMTLTFDL